MVLAVLKLYDFVRGSAELREAPAIHNGERILSLERWLHLDVERRANLFTTSHSALNYLAAGYYQYVHTLLTMAVLAWCWWSRPALYRRARNALVLINLLGLATFFLVPVAPPRLLPGAGFADGVELAGLGGPQDVVHADQFGAMPSLHIAWALWTATVCWLAFGRSRRARAWFAYPLVTTLAVVVTGNHYLLDAVAGAAVAGTALTASTVLAGLRRAPAVHLEPVPHLAGLQT